MDDVSPRGGGVVDEGRAGEQGGQVAPSPTLEPHHLKTLVASGITKDVIAARGYRTVRKKRELADLGFSEKQRQVPTLLVPVHGVAGGDPTLYQHRPDSPRRDKAGKPIKYETPTGAAIILDVPPSIRMRLGDPRVPLYITEGVKKADSAASRSRGLCCIALLGVWNFRGKNAAGGLTALPDWESVALNGRVVYVVFDSDVMAKRAVHEALVRLKGFLESRKADVKLVYLPSGPGGAKQGLDDFFVAGGSVDDLLALAADELRPPPLDDAPRSHPYREHQGGIVLDRDTGSVPLTNFTARIVAQARLDDGAESRQTFEIEARHGSRVARFPLSAARYDSLAWVTDQLGGEAIVSPGQTVVGHVRAAIKHLSTPIRTRVAYAHTGWRQLDGGWVYLHGAGAIGATGAVPGIDCELDGLPHFGLPDPPTGPALADAVRASLRLLELAPLRITAPVIGAVYRAPIGTADFAAHVAGRSGGFKTQLVALGQQHFGAEMDALHLPGSWESTPNAIEARAFLLADTVFVVDDFVSRGSSLEQQKIHAAAARLFRAQGNRSGRQRMRADGTLRPDRPPRGIIISTGEDAPRGESVRARVLIVDVAHGDIKTDRLSACQKDAAAGLYAQAMAGYIRWLAARLGSVQERQAEIRVALRDAALREGAHRRTPGLVADVASGIGWLLRYAADVGAITEADAEATFDKAWAALGDLAAAQAALSEASDPARRYLELLGAVIASGRGHLAAASDGVGVPPEPEAHGWQRGEDDQWRPRGRSIGWIKGGSTPRAYLIEPDAALAEVAGLATTQGEPFPTSRETIARRLYESGVSEVETEGGRLRYHRREYIGVGTGSTRRRVLTLRSLYPTEGGPIGPEPGKDEDAPGISWDHLWRNDRSRDRSATGPARPRPAMGPVNGTGDPPWDQGGGPEETKAGQAEFSNGTGGTGDSTHNAPHTEGPRDEDAEGEVVL